MKFFKQDCVNCRKHAYCQKYCSEEYKIYNRLECEKILKRDFEEKLQDSASELFEAIKKLDAAKRKLSKNDSFTDASQIEEIDLLIEQVKGFRIKVINELDDFRASGK